MARRGPTLLLLTEDMELARKLVRLLDKQGVLAYWVTDEEKKLAQLWVVRAWILDVSPRVLV